MMTQSDFSRAAAEVREVELSTFGRLTGRPSRRTIWITTDALGRVHIRSGQGLSRDWPRNLLANPRERVVARAKLRPGCPPLNQARR